MFTGHGFTTVVGVVAAITGSAANSNTAAVIVTMLNTVLTFVFIVLLYYTSYLHVMIFLYAIYMQQIYVIHIYYKHSTV